MYTIVLLACLAQGKVVIGPIQVFHNEVPGLHRNIRVVDHKTGESHDFYAYGTDMRNTSYSFDSLPEGSWVKATKTPVERDYIEVIDSYDDERMGFAQEASLAQFTDGPTLSQANLIYDLGNSRKQADRKKIMKTLVDRRDYRTIFWAMKSNDCEARYMADLAFGLLTVNKYQEGNR